MVIVSSVRRIPKLAFAHILMRVGIDDNDRYIEIADKFSHAMANAGTPGGTPPDIFPFCMLSFLHSASAYTTQSETCSGMGPRRMVVEIRS